eukprot:548461-Amphidinium_carterae.1
MVLQDCWDNIIYLWDCFCDNVSGQNLDGYWSNVPGSDQVLTGYWSNLTGCCSCGKNYWSSFEKLLVKC